MNKAAPNPYLRTAVLTASPEELRLMLYDGCLKFTRHAASQLAKDEPDFEAVYVNFMKAQKIVLELSTSLNHSAAPELCDRLSALYTYIYRLLVDSNMDRDPVKATEAVELLEYERETWRLLMQQNAAPATPAGETRPNAISSLSHSA